MTFVRPSSQSIETSSLSAICVSRYRSKAFSPWSRKSAAQRPPSPMLRARLSRVMFLERHASANRSEKTEKSARMALICGLLYLVTRQGLPVQLPEAAKPAQFVCWDDGRSADAVASPNPGLPRLSSPVLGRPHLQLA